MARPIWKGNISFGLVNIPITLFTAENKQELHFKLLDRRTRSEVRYERVSEATGQQVPLEEIVRGYRYEGGDYILLTEEDFKKAAVEATQMIEISDFVDLKSIEYTYFEKPYYVVPDKRAEKGYVLLREVLRRTGKVAISKVVIRTRQYLAALIPQGDALVLEILRYYREIREQSEFHFPAGSLEEYKVSERELQVAQMLVESMTGEWDPMQYHDEYHDALMQWIEQKARAGGAVSPAGERAEGRERGKVVDMMELLKQSVEQAAARRGRARDESGEEPGQSSAGGAA